MHAMQVCAKHGKKRQVVYLQRCPQTNDWICKPTDQCKLCGSGNGGNRGIHFKDRQGGRLSRHSDSDWLVRDSREKFIPPERRTSDHQTSEKSTWHALDTRGQVEEKESPPALPAELEDSAEPPCNTSIITSWADEVDKEFPFPQGEVTTMEELTAQNGKVDAAPSAEGTTFVIPYSKQASEMKASNRLSLSERVEILEEELAMTKRELNKTRQNLSRIIQNEKTMETKVRNLCSEIIRMRQQQLQLDLSCRSAEDRRSVGQLNGEMKAPNNKHVVIGGRLNPDAMPFLPSTQLQQTMDSGLSSPTADSARSNPYVENAYSSAQFAGNSLLLQPALTVNSTALQVDSARAVDSARSTQNVDSARTASARSSNFSVATNGSIVSLDSDTLDQVSPRY
jgi:hypothetical protein